MRKGAERVPAGFVGVGSPRARADRTKSCCRVATMSLRRSLMNPTVSTAARVTTGSTSRGHAARSLRQWCPAGDGKCGQRHREDEDEQYAEKETRNRQGDRAQERCDTIDDAAGAISRVHPPDGDGDEQREDDGQGGQFDCDWQTFEDRLGHRDL